jgi:hypothetical protein
MVQRQAVMLSFLDVFQILSIMFLAIIPLIFIMKRPAKARAREIAVH